MQFYSVDKLLSNASDALLGSNTKHSGKLFDLNEVAKRADC